MKDYVLELASKQTDSRSKFNIMREYVQAYILRILHDEGLFRISAFVGGTALRFLHNLPRFSEDLDFSLAKAKEIKFAPLMKKVETELALSGYNVALSYHDEATVRNALIKFEGLMYEAGISPLKSQKFSVKIEIDTRPPEGAILKIEIVNKYFPIDFLAYDLPSLFAGKLNAILSRRYTKGRDYFDLFWYLTKWRDLVPNVALLRNGLTQMAWKYELPTENNWKQLIHKVVKESDWSKVREDVEKFLERPRDIEILTKETLLKVIEGES